MSKIENEFEYKFYAVNKEKKLVYGFDDENEVREYCKINGYVMNKRNTLSRNKIDPNDYNNWSDDFVEPNF